jgi:CMP-N-acetylneuraminic acid synthetase
MVLGLIPARRGSKGILRKNIRRLGRFPLIEYTLRAAQAAQKLDAVAVTTDDPEVARIARRLKVKIIARPKLLARDRSLMIEAVLHALKVLAAEGCQPDVVTLLQPTSPFRTTEHIDRAIHLFLRSEAESLLSVNSVSQHPCECVRREKGRLQRAVNLPRRATGRQEFPKYLYVNGAIYITRTAMLLKKRIFWDAASEIYLMPSLNSMDIDEPHDWALAEALLQSHSHLIGPTQ